MNKNDFKGFTSAHTAPQMENVENGEQLAFTISPKRLTMIGHNISPFGEPANWCKQVIFDLIEQTKFCDYEDIHVEVSSKGRLHLHGYITLRNKLFFYTHDLPALAEIGTYCIKKLFLNEDETKDDEGVAKWDSYIGKQFDTWKLYFTKYSWNYPNKLDKMKFPFNFPLESEAFEDVYEENAYDPIETRLN